MELKSLILFSMSCFGIAQAVPSCPDNTPHIIFYPDPENCSQYYECYSGVLSHMNCPVNLYWNSNADTCDYKSNVDCSSRPRIALALPSCPDNTPQIIFYPDPEDCSKYYECYSGVLNRMNCPANLYWNSNADTCDYESNVDCGSRPHPGATTAASTASPTTRTTPSTITTTPKYDPNPQCTSSSGIQFYPDPSNCQQFFECNEGKRFTIVCPDQLLYNVDVTACDYPENVNCAGRSTSVIASSTSASSPTTRSTPTSDITSTASPTFDPNPQCPASSENIVFYPDPSNCKQYFECNRGTRFTMSCPDNLLYNVNEKACDYPENVDCTARSTPQGTATSQIATSTIAPTSTSTSSPPSSTSSPFSTTFDPNPQCPASSQNIEFYPDPSNCKQYFECNRGTRFTMSCPDNLLYNVNEKACDYAENVDCSGRSTAGSTVTTVSTPSPTSPTTSTAVPTFDPNPQCPASSQNIEFYPDPSNCNQYFECNRGTRFTMSCPDNLLYNVNEKACDYAENVDCSGRSTGVTTVSTPSPTTPSTPSPTTPSTTSTPVPTFDPNPQCPASSQNIDFYPDPSNCKQYFECDRGTRFTLTCPDALLYNTNVKACDYPQNVDCSGRSTLGPLTSGSSPAPASGPCANKADGEYAGDPKDCTVFYECLGGNGTARPCGTDLYWCQQELTCDHQNKQGCSCYT